MKTTWRTIISTVGMGIVLLLTVALLSGFIETMEGRWALGTFAIFIIVGVAGLLTGSDSLMKHSWSRYALYAVSAAILVVTFVNAFIDSQAWFVASSALALVVWAEYISVTYLIDKHASTDSERTPPHAFS